MYKLIGENNGKRTVMYIMLSFEKHSKYAKVYNGSGQIAQEIVGT